MYTLHSPWTERKLGSVIQELQHAWVQMAENRLIGAVVRPVIADSWLRCLNFETDYDKKTAPLRWKGAELEQGLKNNEKLLELVRPVINQLYQYISGSGFLISLSDSEGILLEIEGDPHVLERGFRNNFVLGADWSEESAGTNGIGTCLRIQNPVQILSAEHYCRGWHDWTCSGAPIRDPITGRILGVLDVSGGQGLVHAHNLGIVVTAARVIEQQLKEWQFQLAQRMHRLVVDAASDGMIVVEPNGAVSSINASAFNTLGLTFYDGGHIHSIFQLPQLHEKLEESLGGRSIVEDEIVLSNARRRVVISCIPIQYGKIFAGTLIVVRRLASEATAYRHEFESAKALANEKSIKKGFDLIITNSPSMESVIRRAAIATGNNANVLLLGESGTGKELFARAIHEESERKNGPFVALNCGAIPRDLVASELFGYTEGSFTGALRKGKKGKFELASDGTLFLDEIGEMPLDMQVSLLRALEERVVYPIGAEEGIPVKCRIIAATNQNLMKQVDQGKFRHDLYYRLHVLTLEIPPLRERGGDVLHLAGYFLKQFGRSLFDLEQDVKELFLSYPWPGNIRQLKNTIESLVYLSNGSSITKDMLPSEIQSYSSKKSNPPIIEEEVAERETIILALRESNHNYSQTAKKLGISRATLYRKFKKYMIEL